MSEIVSSDHKNTIIACNGQITINNEKIETPKSMKTNIVINNDGNIYVGGYQFFPKKKKFKRTIRAFLECYIF